MIRKNYSSDSGAESWLTMTRRISGRKLRKSGRLPAPLLSALILAFLSPLAALAGGGPSGCVVLYDPSDVNAVTVAACYQQVRGIPERNMIPYVFPVSFTRTTGWDFIYSLRQTLAARGIDQQLQCIALAAPAAPESASQTLPTGNITSLHSFIYASPSYGQATYPSAIYNVTNTAYSDAPANFRGPVPTGTRALSGATAINGKTFWPISSIGLTGRSSLSPKEALAFLERSKLHDSAKADGTVYWPLNSNIRSLTRQSEIRDVAETWRTRGIKYWVTGDSAAFNGWPTNRTDIAGGIAGIANFSIHNGNTILPGSWIDHLTSNGGEWNTFNPGQTSATQWLRAGADGSSGTMSEPYAVAGKFPHAHIQTHFRAGASLVEAFWQSIENPAEILCAGDPLLQPFADFPVVNVSAPADGATVSGNLAISVTASGTNGKVIEPNLDLFVGGKRVAIGAAGETVAAARVAGGFTLNTATIPDGWHELRVAAYNADAVRTQTEARFSINVNNAGQSLALAGPATINPDSTANFAATVTGLGDLTALTLQANGRTLGTFPVAGGAITADLGATGVRAPLDGSWTLFAIGTRANGQQIFSPPLTTVVSWPAMPATPAPALGGALADVRFFLDTSTGGFNWDTATPDAIKTTAGDPTHGLYLTPTNIPGITISDYTTKKPGYQLDFWFHAPSDDWYEIGFDFGAEKNSQTRSAFIDGLALVESDFRFQPRRLAAGWHSVRCRTALNNALWASWKIRIRGGSSQDFAPITGASAANTGPGTPAQIPTISSITSANPVTGTTVTLTASATVASGSPLTYHWTQQSGPEPVVFSTNGTGSPLTTGTFSGAGNYTFALRVSGTAGSVTSTRSVTVSRTPTAPIFIGTGVVTTGTTTVIRGDSQTAISYTKDQFARRMEITPTSAGQPTMRWSTTDPNATLTPLTPDGERISFRSLSGVTSPQTFSLTATGINGRTGAATTSILVNPNSPPEASGTALFDISQSGPGASVQFLARASDPDDSYGLHLTYAWSVISTPAGQTLTLANTIYPTTSGTPSGTGNYSVRLVVTDRGGETVAGTRTFFVDAAGNAVAPPTVSNPFAGSTYVGELANFSVSASSGAALQWQVSSDSGATWQSIPGATSSLITVGPVGIADAGKQYRVIATNAAGTATSDIATLTVQNPDGGVIQFAGETFVEVPEAVGTLQITVLRAGQSIGATSVRATLMADGGSGLGGGGSPVLGSDYQGFDGANQTVKTLTWAAGDNSPRILTVPIINDAIAENTESFYVELDNVTGSAELTYRTTYYVSILDEDGPGTASFSAVGPVTYENHGSAVFTVQRTGGTAGTLGVNYSTASKTAVAGQDFTGMSGPLVWANGDTAAKLITVPLTNDGVPEGDETFSVVLSGSAGTVGFPSIVTATLKDAPYQTWQRTYWPTPTPPQFGTLAAGVQSFAPAFLFRCSETGGTSLSAVNGIGALVVTGTLAKTGTNNFLLNQIGPRPATWSGLENTNTALGLTASGATTTPAQYSAGAYASLGNGNSLGPKIANGFTFTAFVKTNIADRVMNVFGAQHASNGEQFSVFVNREYNNALAPVPHALRVYVRSDNNSILDYSVVLANTPTGSLCDGQWHHIAITVPKFTGTSTSSNRDNADYPRFYFDGVELNVLNVRGVEAILSTHTFSEFANVRLGAGGAASVGAFFHGTLDEVAVLPKVLAPADIVQLMGAGPATLPPPAAALTANPTGDGLINGLKYALGLNPLLPGVLPFAQGFITVGTEDYLALTYTENVNATDLGKLVEVSGDLAQWDSGPAFTTVVSSSTVSDIRTVTVRDNVPVTPASPSRFIRVKVSGL